MKKVRDICTESQIKAHRKEIRSFCSHLFSVSKDRYGFKDDWVPIIKVSFDERRWCSYGGVTEFDYGDDNPFKQPDIDLAVAECFTTERYHEVQSIDQDPEIGGFIGSAENYWKALACHEVAHAIEYSLADFECNALGARLLMTHGAPNIVTSCHGKLWQHLYRELRNQFVNQKITETEH